MLTGVSITDLWLKETCWVLKCKIDSIPFVYLDIPIGGDCRRLSFGTLSLNALIWGCLILLKFVMSSLFVYFISFFKAPHRYNILYESIFKRFFFGNWDFVCRSKEDGGLGVTRMRELNLLLLCKWCWRMSVDKDGLWYSVLNARYWEEGGDLKREVG